MNFNEAYHRTWTILSDAFLVALAYMLCKVLLSLWIEGNSKAETITGKITTALFCIAGSGLTALGFSLMFKSSTTGLTAFFTLLPCSIIAAFVEYDNNRKLPFQ